MRFRWLFLDFSLWGWNVLNFLKIWGWAVLNLFLISAKFEAHCSYKIVLIKKKRVQLDESQNYYLKTEILCNKANINSLFLLSQMSSWGHGWKCTEPLTFMCNKLWKLHHMGSLVVWLSHALRFSNLSKWPG